MLILNLEPEGYSSAARSVLETCGRVSDGPLSREELKRRIADVDILIVRLGHRIDREIFEYAKRLKFIVSGTTGLNHIDLAEAYARGIAVLSLKGETEFLNGVTATAEHSWALLLALVRKLPDAFQDVRTGEWRRDLFKGSELSGKTLGVIGCGRLGRQVAAFGAAFRMNVVVSDVRKIDGYDQRPLNDLLAVSDIVSLHVPFDDTTNGFFDVACFRRMKAGAFLINTARGEVLDEDALLINLESGRLAGAALDVMRGENGGDPQWMTGDPLIRYALSHDNLLLTPHIGGATIESMEKTEIFMAQKLKKYLDAI